MHVVGARFASLRSAATALAEIRASVAVPHADVAVRPLGSTHYEEPATDFLLAGRFAAGDVERVIEIARVHGGSLLSSRVEPSRAHLPGSAGASTSQRVPRTERVRTGDAHVSPADLAARPSPGAQGRKRVRRPDARLRVRAARASRLGA